MASASVIVPVYNVEQHLGTCVESLLAQTHEDFEIILVDDGSSDSSGQLCDAFAAGDPRVRALHQPNRGLSGARNTGLAEAVGDYVFFVDSDDWCESAMVERMVAAAIAEDADVVVAGAFIDTVDENEQLLTSERRLLSKVSHTGRTLTLDSISLLGYAWNKAYRRELIDSYELLFEQDLTLVEDVVFNAAIWSNMVKVIDIGEAFVHYVQRPMPSLGRTSRPDSIALRRRAHDSLETILLRSGVDDRVIASTLARHSIVSIKSAILATAQGEGGFRVLRANLQSPDAAVLSASLTALQDASWSDRLMARILVGGHVTALSLISFTVALSLARTSRGMISAVTRLFGHNHHREHTSTSREITIAKIGSPSVRLDGSPACPWSCRDHMTTKARGRTE